MTPDYKRHGVTTLFAALNTLDGIVVRRRMPRHTHQELTISSRPPLDTPTLTGSHKLVSIWK